MIETSIEVLLFCFLYKIKELSAVQSLLQPSPMFLKLKIKCAKCEEEMSQKSTYLETQRK